MLLKTPKPRTKLAKKKPKAEEDEYEYEYTTVDDPSPLLQLLQNNNNTLESRGIIIIDNAISKQTLASATRKLMEFHFDPEFEDEIQIILNSPGGYTDAGNAFIDLMQWCRLKVRTIALGEIASMATLIFIHGDERVMAPNSIAMIHQFSSANMGNYTDLVAYRKYEDIEQKRHLKMFVNCSKYKTEEDVQKYLLKSHDNYLTPEEMMEHGLCDGVFESNKKLRNNDGKTVQRNSKRGTKR